LDRIVQTRAERTVIAPRGSGVLGWGLPAALGVKLGRPSDRVTCLTGDGGLYFSLGELESAVRIGLPIVLVLLNNRSYGFQWHADRHRLGRDHADLHFGEHVDYDALASAFGWEAVSVAHLSDFSAAYADARSADGPTFIDVQVDREAFPPLAEFDVEDDPKGLP
jgi:acetolactate synthase-1/2/3 large subunit